MPFEMAQAPVEMAHGVKFIYTDTLLRATCSIYDTDSSARTQQVSEDYNHPESDAVPATHTPPLVVTEHKNSARAD